MFERFFSWRAFMKFKKQEVLARKKYQEHLRFGDGRRLHIYSNEIIDSEKLAEVSEFMQENFDIMDDLDIKISDIAMELVTKLFDSRTGVSIYVVEPRREYELTVIFFA